jgi:hypothetical protein
MHRESGNVGLNIVEYVSPVDSACSKNLPSQRDLISGRAPVMFAPLIAKRAPSAVVNSGILRRRHNDGAIQRAHTHDRRLGERDDGALTGEAPGEAGQVFNQTQGPPRRVGPSWDFSKIPLFSPDRPPLEGAPDGSTAPVLPDFNRGSIDGTPLRLQAKLKVSAPEDVDEQEADLVADKILRMPEPRLQRACACGGQCAECQSRLPDAEHQSLQPKRTGIQGTGCTTAPPVVHQVLSAPGHPLDPSTRSFMEPRFGHDLGHIRIHTDRKAAESARAVQSKAYTVGNQVVFGEGEYAPRTFAGQRLLAHELVLRTRHMIHHRLLQPPRSLRHRSNQLNHLIGSEH